MQFRFHFAMVRFFSFYFHYTVKPPTYNIQKRLFKRYLREQVGTFDQMCGIYCQIQFAAKPKVSQSAVESVCVSCQQGHSHRGLWEGGGAGLNEFTVKALRLFNIIGYLSCSFVYKHKKAYRLPVFSKSFKASYQLLSVGVFWPTISYHVFLFNNRSKKLLPSNFKDIREPGHVHTDD